MKKGEKVRLADRVEELEEALRFFEKEFGNPCPLPADNPDADWEDAAAWVLRSALGGNGAGS